MVNENCCRTRFEPGQLHHSYSDGIAATCKDAKGLGPECSQSNCDGADLVIDTAVIS